MKRNAASTGFLSWRSRQWGCGIHPPEGKEAALEAPAEGVRPGLLVGCGFLFRVGVVGFLTCDFVCYQHRLIVELDGSQHADSHHDARRHAWLRLQGFTVLRFWNDEIMSDCDDVLETIYNAAVNTVE